MRTTLLQARSVGARSKTGALDSNKAPLRHNVVAIFTVVNVKRPTLSVSRFVERGVKTEIPVLFKADGVILESGPRCAEDKHHRHQFHSPSKPWCCVRVGVRGREDQARAAALILRRHTCLEMRLQFHEKLTQIHNKPKCNRSLHNKRLLDCIDTKTFSTDRLHVGKT